MKPLIAIHDRLLMLLLLVSFVTHSKGDTGSIRHVREKRGGSIEPIEPTNAFSTRSESVRISGQSRIDHYNQSLSHHGHHNHQHFDRSELDPHEPCGARVSIEERRMMDQAQEVWEEQNHDRTRKLRQGRALSSVKIDVWFHV